MSSNLPSFLPPLPPNKKPYFYPFPRSYAVAQIDVEASLRGLGELDSEARAAVRRIRPSKALIMFHSMDQMPLPKRFDFTYTVDIVGPGLRPDRPEDCFTPEMCIPIFPNSKHPSGRPPVRTEPEFPFSNCYHWFCPDMQLTLRVKNEKDKYGVIDEIPKFFMLPADQYVDMMMLHQEDINQVLRNLKAKEPTTPAPPPHSVVPGEDDGPEALGQDEGEGGSEDDRSVYSGFVSEPDDPQDKRSDVSSLPSGPDEAAEDLDDDAFHDDDDAAEVRSFTESEVFKMNHNAERALMPVVTMSFDLTAHFSCDEEVPDPMPFIDDCNVFTQMVKELQERQARRQGQQEERPRRIKVFKRVLRSLVCFQ